MSTPYPPDPRNHRHGASGTTTDTRESDPEPHDRPSLLQITASALTAVTATALLSFLGLWGTVFGMGLLSILTVLGNYLWSTSLQRTADKVKQVRPPTQGARGSQPAKAAASTSLAPGWHSAEPSEPSRPTAAREGLGERLRASWRSMVERYGARRIVLSIVAVFVVLAGTITVIEVVAGKPMTDIVRNDSGGGTSVFGGNTSGGDGTDGPSDSDRKDQEIQPENEEDAPEDAPEESPGEDSPEETPDESQPEDGDTSTEEPPVEEPPADEPAPEDSSTQ